MGAEAAAGPSTLRLRLPRRAEVTVLRDGEPVHAGALDALDLDVADPGAYRVEARIDGRAWLFSNPVHLR
jgi:hypothetical protein